LIQFDLHKTLKSAKGKIDMQVSCSFASGGFITLYGPSGAGKTTLLRMLAGLIKPDRGFIKVENKTWFDAEKRIDVAPQKEKDRFCFPGLCIVPKHECKAEYRLWFGQR
jgi:molybdate transport system ATP-binding protein